MIILFNSAEIGKLTEALKYELDPDFPGTAPDYFKNNPTAHAILTDIIIDLMMAYDDIDDIGWLPNNEAIRTGFTMSSEITFCFIPEMNMYGIIFED